MNEVVRPEEKVTPAAIRLAVEWLAANANGISLIDWEPRSQTLLNAADEIERLQAQVARRWCPRHQKTWTRSAQKANSCTYPTCGCPGTEGCRLAKNGDEVSK